MALFVLDAPSHDLLVGRNTCGQNGVRLLYNNNKNNNNKARE